MTTTLSQNSSPLSNFGKLLTGSFLSTKYIQTQLRIRWGGGGKEDFKLLKDYKDGILLLIPRMFWKGQRIYSLCLAHNSQFLPQPTTSQHLLIPYILPLRIPTTLFSSISYLCYTQVPPPPALSFYNALCHAFLLFLIIYNLTLHTSDQPQRLMQNGDTRLCRGWPREGNQFGTWTPSALCGELKYPCAVHITELEVRL